MDVRETTELFRAVEKSGARALLIGRRALICLGLPVMTVDYDFWIHIDDIAQFNQALAVLDLVPNDSPDEARKRLRASSSWSPGSRVATRRRPSGSRTSIGWPPTGSRRLPVADGYWYA